jgi:hypothetical protein
MMKEIYSTGGSAFPSADYEYTGMTLRDYFAAKAMQAFIGKIESGKEDESTMIPDAAYLMADRMLEARK